MTLDKQLLNTAYELPKANLGHVCFLISPDAVFRSTSYTLILSLHGLSADVIGSVAFGEQLGALEYEEQQDGSVQLASQEFMQVWQLLA